MKIQFLLVLCILFFNCNPAVDEVFEKDPPYHGTIFLDPDIILPTDPSAFQSLNYSGQEIRTMFDRRVNDWVEVNAFIFDVTYNDGLTTRAQVNPEFETKESAEIEAEKYAIEVGRLPSALRRDVNELWIHKGENLFGGGNNSILIHTGQSANYEADGILEETLVHEASHTSLDADYSNHPDWLDAQKKDPTFISTYARDNPEREDIAETFLLYLAVEYRSHRINTELKTTVEETVPNRLSFFRNLPLDLYPFEN